VYGARRAFSVFPLVSPQVSRGVSANWDNSGDLRLLLGGLGGWHESASGPGQDGPLTPLRSILTGLESWPRGWSSVDIQLRRVGFNILGWRGDHADNEHVWMSSVWHG
jgi:hypothetical protein